MPKVTNALTATERHDLDKKLLKYEQEQEQEDAAFKAEQQGTFDQKDIDRYVAISNDSIDVKIKLQLYIDMFNGEIVENDEYIKAIVFWGKTLDRKHNNYVNVALDFSLVKSDWMLSRSGSETDGDICLRFENGVYKEGWKSELGRYGGLTVGNVEEYGHQTVIVANKYDRYYNKRYFSSKWKDAILDSKAVCEARANLDERIRDLSEHIDNKYGKKLWGKFTTLGSMDEKRLEFDRDGCWIQ